VSTVRSSFEPCSGLFRWTRGWGWKSVRPERFKKSFKWFVISASNAPPPLPPWSDLCGGRRVGRVQALQSLPGDAQEPQTEIPRGESPLLRAVGFSSVETAASLKCVFVCVCVCVCVCPLQLAALEFPPKKLFGNRDERMVAERRNHLEVTRSIQFYFINFFLKGGLTLLLFCCFSLPALSEELVPRDAVVVQLAPQSRRGRRRRAPPLQTRRLWAVAVLQEGRVRVQQPRHRLTPPPPADPASSNAKKGRTKKNKRTKKIFK